MTKRCLLRPAAVLALPALLLPLLYAPPVAAEGAVDKEIDFARGLGRRQYFDWAEEVCLAIEKTATGPDKASVQLVRAEIIKGQAAGETDLKKKIEGIAKAIQALESFLSSNPNHPLAEEAKFDIGDLYLQKGLFVITELKNPESAPKAGDLRKEGQDAFKQAKSYIEKMISQIRERMDKPDEKKNEEKNTVALVTARYNLLKTCYYFGMLYDAGSSERKDYHTKAKTHYMDFSFDYQDRIYYYIASIIGGLVYKELGEDKMAIGIFDAGIALRDSYFDEKTRGYVLDDTAIEILRDAFTTKTQAMIDMKDGKATVATVEEFFKTFGPEWKKKPLGWYMDEKKAEGYALLGDNKAAMDLVAEVLDKTKDGPEKIHNDASALITKLGGSIEISADRLLQGAEGLAARGKEDEAIVEYRRVLLALKTKTDPESLKLTQRTWYRMAVAFDKLDRTYEAASIYQRIYTTWPDAAQNPYASKACLGTARSFTSMLASGDNAFDQEQYKKALKDLSEKYVSTEEGKMAPVLLGEKLSKEGKFVEAADQFARVPSNVGAYYVQCLFQVGYCWYQEGRRLWTDKKESDAKAAFKKAEDGFQRSAAEIEKQGKTATEEIKKELGEMAFNGRFMTAQLLVHESVKRTDDALKLLDQMEQEYAGAQDKLSRCWSLKIQTFLDQKKPQEARELLDQLLEKDPNAKKVSDLCKQVAFVYHSMGEEKRKDVKAGNTVGLDDLRSAARYYTIWLERSAEGARGLKPADISSVGDLLYRVGNVANGLAEVVGSFQETEYGKVAETVFYEAAAKAYDLLVNGKFANPAAPDYWKNCVKLVNCLAFIKKWPEAVAVYEKILTDEKFCKEVTDEKTKQKFLRIDDKVLRAKPHLLGIYLDVGQLYLEVAPAQKEAWDKALNVFGNIGDPQISDKEQRQWWQSKLGYLQALYGGGNYMRANVIIVDLRAANPKWENNKHGLTAKLDELEKSIKEKVPATPKK
ncbi:MAG: hypothetical protein HYZ53_23260 [Planctomycetes bacterium]|nr:hypothetical protein [Planctomycetota bacterium]